MVREAFSARLGQFQRIWVSSCENWVRCSEMLCLIQADVGQFQRDCIGFSEVGSVSARLGEFQRVWVSFSAVGSASAEVGEFQRG